MITVKHELDMKALNKELNKLPGLMQAASYDKGLRPAANVFNRRVKELTPRSKNTRTTDKWDAKVKNERQGELPLWKTTKVKLWRSSTGFSLGMVGFEWPKGNKGYLVIQHRSESRRVVYWGNRTQRLARKVDVLKRAFDDARQPAAAAWTAAVAKDVKNKLRQLGRG